MTGKPMIVVDSGRELAQFFYSVGLAEAFQMNTSIAWRDAKEGQNIITEAFWGLGSAFYWAGTGFQHPLTLVRPGYAELVSAQPMSAVYATAGKLGLQKMKRYLSLNTSGSPLAASRYRLAQKASREASWRAVQQIHSAVMQIDGQLAHFYQDIGRTMSVVKAAGSVASLVVPGRAGVTIAQMLAVPATQVAVHLHANYPNISATLITMTGLGVAVDLSTPRAITQVSVHARSIETIYQAAAKAASDETARFLQMARALPPTGRNTPAMAAQLARVSGAVTTATAQAQAAQAALKAAALTKQRLGIYGHGLFVLGGILALTDLVNDWNSFK